MTGRETLTLLAACHGVGPRDRRERVETLAQAFGAHTHLDRKIAHYSGGLRRRLHLAGALVHDPDLLLLDEPTAGLDDPGRQALWVELRRRAGVGRTVVIVTHELGSVQEEANQVVVLEGGHLLASASPGELIQSTPAPSTPEAQRRTNSEPVGPAYGRPIHPAATGGPDLTTAYRHLTGRVAEPLAPSAQDRRTRISGEFGDTET